MKRGGVIVNNHLKNKWDIKCSVDSIRISSQISAYSSDKPILANCSTRFQPAGIRRKNCSRLKGGAIGMEKCIRKTVRF